jgi:hypothetical protein
MGKSSEILQQTSRYKGITKKKYKRLHKSSTPGKTKGDNCQANAIKKGVTKYPRWYRTNPELYMSICALTDKAAKGRKTACGGTLV